MKRLLTAFVALPILLYTVWSEIPYFFVAIAAIAILLALNEFYNLASKAGCHPLSVAGHAAALVVIAIFIRDRPQAGSLHWIAAALARHSRSPAPRSCAQTKWKRWLRIRDGLRRLIRRAAGGLPDRPSNDT